MIFCLLFIITIIIIIILFNPAARSFLSSIELRALASQTLLLLSAQYQSTGKLSADNRSIFEL